MTMTKKKRREGEARQRAVIARLGMRATGPIDPSELLNFVSRVLKEEGITRDDFNELDERPGQYSGGYNGPNGEWHFRLRRWRNHSHYSSPFHSVSTLPRS
jgi:hypothetical protein